MYVTYGLQALTLCIYISMGFSDSPGRACYHAKICVHNAIEKCGIDSKGTVRRFLDSCDIKEYNCLKGTDFVKTDEEECRSLPLMDVKEKKEKQSLSDEISKTDVESMTLKSTTNVSKSVHQGINIIISTNAQKIKQNEENGTEQEYNMDEEQEEEEVEEEANLDNEEVESNEASKVNDDVDENINTEHDSLREEDNVSEASDAADVNAKNSDNEEQSPNGEKYILRE